MSDEFLSVSQLKSQKNINEEEILFRYKLEREAMNAVTNGDYEAVRGIDESNRKEYPYNPYIQRLPDNLLRDRKNGSVIRNTLFRTAAYEGGLPPIYIHLISERIALKIERATSVDYLDNVLSVQMVEEYCDAVKNFSTSGYSNLMKQIASYISDQFTESLTLQDIADEFHINASHLSRKFKKETGYTFSHYVNHKRLEYAKLLFYEDHSNITEVASLAGFNSSSYFSKVFKKEVGISPKEYLQNLP